jgi:exonuclease VII large subunit
VLNPVNILKRGFAVIYSGEEIITGADGLEAADPISIRFYESKISATVNAKTKLDGSIANL